MLSERAQRIMQHVSKTGTIDIDTALKVSGGYYHNGRKHIGEVLSTLVRNGYIERIKPMLFKFETMIATEKEFDASLKILCYLYEEGKDCLYSLQDSENKKEFWRLFDILKEMRDLSAVNMQKLHFKIEN